jgi:hypothetical protein
MWLILLLPWDSSSSTAYGLRIEDPSPTHIEDSSKVDDTGLQALEINPEVGEVNPRPEKAGRSLLLEAGPKRTQSGYLHPCLTDIGANTQICKES